MHLLKHILGWPWAFRRCNLPWTKRYTFQSSLIPPVWRVMSTNLKPWEEQHVYLQFYTRFWHGQLVGKYTNLGSHGFYGFGRKGLHLVVKKPNKYVFQPNLRQDFESTRNVSGKHVNHLPLQGRRKLHIPNLGKKGKNHHRLKSALEQGCSQTLESPIFSSENSGTTCGANLSANDFLGDKAFQPCHSAHNHGSVEKWLYLPWESLPFSIFQPWLGWEFVKTSIYGGFWGGCAKCTEIKKKPGCLDNKERGWFMVLNPVVAIRKKSPKKQIQQKSIPIFWQLWLVFRRKWMEINVATYFVRGAMPLDSVATGVMDVGFTGVIDISVATGEGSI